MFGVSRTDLHTATMCHLGKVRVEKGAVTFSAMYASTKNKIWNPQQGSRVPAARRVPFFRSFFCQGKQAEETADSQQNPKVSLISQDKKISHLPVSSTGSSWIWSCRNLTVPQNPLKFQSERIGDFRSRTCKISRCSINVALKGTNAISKSF